MTLDSTRGKTLQAALTLLYSSQPEIESILGDEPLCVGLESMHVMRLGQSGEAHVLWMGPALTNPSPATKRLTAVCGECFFFAREICNSSGDSPQTSSNRHSGAMRSLWKTDRSRFDDLSSRHLYSDRLCM